MIDIHYYCTNLIGEVLCTIHTKVLDDHQKELQPGAVLVLRQVHNLYYVVMPVWHPCSKINVASFPSSSALKCEQLSYCILFYSTKLCYSLVQKE